MKAKYACQIRYGIRTAQQVMNRERVGPRLTSWYVRGEMAALPLWERAYHHTMSQAARKGRLRPPTQLNPYVVIRDTITIPK